MTRKRVIENSADALRSSRCGYIGKMQVTAKQIQYNGKTVGSTCADKERNRFYQQITKKQK